MIENRQPEEFEDDLNKWKIYLDINLDQLKSERCIVAKFTLNRKEYPLIASDIEELKRDLKDLGKFRIIKQGKEFSKSAVIPEGAQLAWLDNTHYQ